MSMTVNFHGPYKATIDYLKDCKTAVVRIKDDNHNGFTLFFDEWDEMLALTESIERQVAKFMRGEVVEEED